jgi:hypothetical protein
MLKHTILSLSLLTTIAVSDVTWASSKSQEEIEDESIARALAYRQHWIQLVEDCKNKKKGAQEKYMQEYMILGGDMCVAVNPASDIFGLNFDDFPDEDSLKAHDINKLNENEQYCASNGSRLPHHAWRYLFSKWNALVDKSPKVRLCLADCHRLGLGTNVNIEEYKANVISALCEGDTIAKYRFVIDVTLGKYNMPANPYTATLLAKQLVNKGKFPSAHAILADNHLNALNGETEKDPKRALDHLRNAAENGYASAQYKIGEMYWTGTLTDPNSLVIGAKWLRLADKTADELNLQNIKALIAKLRGIHPTQQPDRTLAISLPPLLSQQPIPITTTVPYVPPSVSTLLSPLPPLNMTGNMASQSSSGQHKRKRNEESDDLRDKPVTKYQRQEPQVPGGSIQEARNRLWNMRQHLEPLDSGSLTESGKDHLKVLDEDLKRVTDIISQSEFDDSDDSDESDDNDEPTDNVV